MTVRGQILSETGEPLDGASITLVNSKGDYLGEGVKADGTGKFAITSNFLKGNYLLVSYAGMQSLMIEPETLTSTTYEEIGMFPALMDEVVVTPDNNKQSDLAALWWLLPLMLGFVVIGGKKKKRT